MKKKLSDKFLIVSFLMGVAALSYQLLSLRYMSLILGSATHVVAVVVSCYMVGWAIGSVVLGAFADKNSKNALHISIAGFLLFCALSPLKYQLISTFLLYETMTMRVLVCFFFMLPAAICIGGIIPSLIKIGDKQTTAASIYAANTFGSVLGVLLCGYVLIKTFGLSTTAWITAGLALVCYAIVFSVRSQTVVKTLPAAKHKPLAITQHYSTIFIIAIIAVYSLLGFASMTFEVFQTKVLTLFFRDSVYDYTIILTVILIGFFIGNILGGRVAAKNNHLLFYFSLTQISAGVLVILGMYIVNLMPAFTFDLVSNHIMYERFGEHAFFMSNVLKFGYSALVILLPAVLWGMGFPLVNKMTVTENKNAGKITGLTLGFNTLLCSAGTLLSAFVLVNIFGIRGTLIFTGVVCIIAGAVLALLGFKKYIQPLGKRKFILPSAILLAAVLWVFMPKWNKFEMAALFIHPADGSAEGLYEILFYREDAHGITAVVDFFPFERRFLVTNRLYRQSSSGLFGTICHQRLGIIPLLIHQNPKDVLVIGLGAGITLRGANNFPDVNITCVEISSAIVKAARYFGEENNHVLDADNVNVIVNDGRNHVRTTNETYDVIIADIFFPATVSSSNVFSREYYEMCRQRLNPGGIMVQWLPMHQFSPDEFAITLKTFASVFEQVQLWFGLLSPTVPVVGLVGSDEPIVIDGARLSEIFAKQHLQEALSLIALGDKYTFLNNFIADMNHISLSNDIPINTDDRPILEFLNPRMEFTAPGFQRAATNMRYIINLRMTSPQNEHFVNIDNEAMTNANREMLRLIHATFIQNRQ